MSCRVIYWCDHCDKEIRPNYDVSGVSGWTRDNLLGKWRRELSPKDTGPHICIKCIKTLLSDKKQDSIDKPS